MSANAARKQRSERALRALRVPVNEHLPALPFDEKSARPRPAEEVARRCLVLSAVQAVPNGRPPKQATAWLRREGLLADASKRERSYLGAARRSPARDAEASWRAEALFTLWWALGLARTLTLGNCDLGVVLDRPRGRPPWIGDPTAAFVAASSLRPAAKLVDAADLVYRAHWAVREAALRGRPLPGALHPDAVAERHHALNWLLRHHCDDDWDDVDTPT